LIQSIQNLFTSPFAANEYLGKQIATIHNLGFYMWLVREARKHILAGDFRTWKEMMVKI
jgi:queuine tRNA-ribosyltransferase